MLVPQLSVAVYVIVRVIVQPAGTSLKEQSTCTGPQLSCAVTPEPHSGMSSGSTSQPRSMCSGAQLSKIGFVLHTQPSGLQFLSSPVLWQLESKVEARKWTAQLPVGPVALIVSELSHEEISKLVEGMKALKSKRAKEGIAK